MSNADSEIYPGFYIFGDAPNLCKSSMLWWHVIQAMARDPCRVGFHLHLTCKKHDEKTFIKESGDFNSLDGGCTKPCREEMPCGHTCVLGCHPFPHDVVNCKNRCNRRLGCGHPCIELCYLPCKSDCRCENDHAVALAAPLSYAEAATESKIKRGSHHGNPQDTQPYRDFAAGGHAEYDKNLAALAEREAAEARGKQLDEENFAALFRDPGDAALVDKNKTMTLVRTMSNGKGGSRGVWKGNYKPPRSENARPSKKEEASLLD